MKRRFRLTRSTDIKRVRRSGKSYAHPLAILYVFKLESDEVRIGVSAGLAVGSAVKRNRAKRLLRAAMNELLPSILPGIDLFLIGRNPLASADLHQTRDALSQLLGRAKLLTVLHDD